MLTHTPPVSLVGKSGVLTLKPQATKRELIQLKLVALQQHINFTFPPPQHARHSPIADMFGSAPNSGGLFGSTQPQASTGGLFGSNTNQAQSQSQSTTGGLFGSTAQPAASGLFGNATPVNNSTGFGGQTAQPATSGLFGSTTTQQNNNQNNSAPGGTSLFSAPTTSLFGTQTQPAQNVSLFGTNAQNQSHNQNQNQNQNTAQSQNQQQMSGSIFNPQTVSVGTHGHTMTHAQLQRLQFSGMHTSDVQLPLH